MANSGQLPVVHISSLMFAVHAKREAKPRTRRPIRFTVAVPGWTNEATSCNNAAQAIWSTSIAALRLSVHVDPIKRKLPAVIIGLVTKDSPLPARLPPKLCRLVGFANLPSLVRMKRPKRAQLVVF